MRFFIPFHVFSLLFMSKLALIEGGTFPQCGDTCNIKPDCYGANNGCIWCGLYESNTLRCRMNWGNGWAL